MGPILQPFLLAFTAARTNPPFLNPEASPQLVTILDPKTCRFVKQQFDLDLTYITNRIIAMSAPAFGGHSSYRNDINVVARCRGHVPDCTLQPENLFPELCAPSPSSCRN